MPRPYQNRFKGETQQAVSLLGVWGGAIKQKHALVEMQLAASKAMALSQPP